MSQTANIINGSPNHTARIAVVETDQTNSNTSAPAVNDCRSTSPASNMNSSPSVNTNNHHHHNGLNQSVIIGSNYGSINFNRSSTSNADGGLKESEKEDGSTDDDTDAIQAKHKAGGKKRGTSEPARVAEIPQAKIIDGVVQLPSEMWMSKNPTSMDETNKWHDHYSRCMDQEQRQSGDTYARNSATETKFNLSIKRISKFAKVFAKEVFEDEVVGEMNRHVSMFELKGVEPIETLTKTELMNFIADVEKNKPADYPLFTIDMLYKCAHVMRQGGTSYWRKLTRRINKYGTTEHVPPFKISLHGGTWKGAKPYHHLLYYANQSVKNTMERINHVEERVLGVSIRGNKRPGWSEKFFWFAHTANRRDGYSYFLICKSKFPMFPTGGKMKELGELLKNVADGTVLADAAAAGGAVAQRAEEESDDTSVLENEDEKNDTSVDGVATPDKYSSKLAAKKPSSPELTPTQTYVPGPCKYCFPETHVLVV